MLGSISSRSWLVVAVLASSSSLWAAAAPCGIEVPPGFPPVPVPEDNSVSAAKVELGRHLFFDTRLSSDGTFACSTCHQPVHAFTDSRPRAIGVTGETHPRGAMALANVAYNMTLNWADPGSRELEEQMVTPMFGVSPIEMGMSGHEDEILSRLQVEPRYGTLFEAAFPESSDPIRFEMVIRAIATFERTLISGDSPYDRYVYWDERSDFSDSARRGMSLFFSERLACSRCHSGFNLSGPVMSADETAPEPLFHNTALYDLDGEGAYPEDNQGVYESTRVPEDMGRFRAPSLRNIARTAPYMHDGSLPTLEAVIDHYARGGRASESPLKSPELKGFELTKEETQDLVSFLESLTDQRFLEDPRFQNPWKTP